MAQVGTKVNDEAVHEVPALIEETGKEPLLDASAATVAASAAATAAATAAVTAASVGLLETPIQPPINSAAQHLSSSPMSTAAQHMPSPMPSAAQHLPSPVPTTVKDDDRINPLVAEEPPLVEVGEAMMAASEVFNRVKSEKIAEQALCSIRNDQSQYEGLAKEIVGKAVKQKERERANRASAAASRAKVLRYQTELESRLNRIEAERNAYRKELHELRNAAENPRKQLTEAAQLLKLQEWIRKMEAANQQFVRSIIAQGEMDKILGEGEEKAPKLEFKLEKEDGPDVKRRRL